MPYADVHNEDLFLVVAQEPFEDRGNQFCKLVPAAYLNGIRADEDEFPNDGEIWWMLTAHTAPLAKPGRLVIGRFENAVRYDEHDPDSSRFQAVRESVRPPEIRDGVEVLEVPGDQIESPQAFVSSSFRLKVAHPPTPRVMLRWRSEVFGPFTTNQVRAVGVPQFTITPTQADMAVFRLDEGQFRDATKKFLVSLETEVSPTAHRRREALRLMPVRHDLLLGAGYEHFLARNPQKLVLESTDRKLNRFAKNCLSRAKRQALLQLLQELETTGRESQDSKELIETVSHFRNELVEQDEALDAVANALLESGVLGEDRLKKAEENHTERYIQARSAELEAQIEAKVNAAREELRVVEGELKDIKTRLQMEEKNRRAQVEKELATVRAKANAEIATERSALETRRSELERQQEILQKNLEQVTRDLRNAGDDVVNRFLTIAPLVGLMAMPAAAVAQPFVSGEPPRATPASRSFELPAFISSHPRPARDTLTEEAFFERFKQLVAESGFFYQPLDLIRFHLSVKTGAITVLGGPSGTGKSSMPLLYSRALIGEQSDDDRPDCLMINVNASWMDARDLLGHMNTLEGRFYPSESGLFERLVYAQEEYANREEGSGLHLVCLDEMNLSQVEHYFSDFMMVLEREGDRREIRCFSPETAGDDCPYRRWSSVKISPAMRFVGTVNFDETTRLLSDRFLDRINLIELKAGTLPAAGSDPGAPARAAGSMVTLSDLESWVGENVLPTELAALLDELRPILQQLGCPVSPRVYRAMCRFVGSSGALLSPAKAFDLQIAQRLLPRVRNLVTKRQLDALDQLLRLLSNTTVAAFDETMPILESVRADSLGSGWEPED